MNNSLNQTYNLMSTSKYDVFLYETVKTIQNIEMISKM